MNNSSDSAGDLTDVDPQTPSFSNEPSPFDPVAVRASRWFLWSGLAVVIFVVWACSGLFVVGADEAAVVRVCGRAERTADGAVQLRSSGLYFHLPWPLTQIERVRINEVRTISIGSLDAGVSGPAEPFLRETGLSQNAQLLSGDKNVLNVQLNVSYRVASDRVGEWLFGSDAVQQRFELLASSVLADVVLRSGVDFVHTLGHNEIRRVILARLGELAAENALGVEIEDVTIAGVTPPVRVKADFVDVMNARADRETYVNRARDYESQRASAASAEATKLKNEAQSYALRKVDRARADAESFNLLIDQFTAAAEKESTSYADVRQMALRQEFIDTLENVLQKAKAKVLLDSGEQVDITLHRNPNGQ